MSSSLVAGAIAVLAMLSSGCGSSPAPSAATSIATSTSRAAKPRSGAAKLVDEWAACERRHGDRGQTDPTIDVHGVIHITTPLRPRGGNVLSGGPETATGTCSTYLARAQRVLRATHHVADPNGPDHATYLKYVACMRANGVPNYPYPEANDPSKTDFIGSGVDPNSPSVIRVNDLCGKKLGLPDWWVKGYGMPGDVSVKTAGVPSSPPACAFKKHGCPTTKKIPGL